MLESKNNNNRGVLYEILINHHLITNNENQEIHPPKRPDNIILTERCNELLKQFTQDEFEHYKRLAKDASQVVKDHFSHRKITDVWWTSNKNDVSKLTGKNINNASDLVIQLDGHELIGISIKQLHSIKPPNKANLGAESINNIFNINVDNKLEYHRNIIRKYIKEKDIDIKEYSSINELVRSHPELKNLDKKEKNEFYYWLKDQIVDCLNDHSNQEKCNLIKQALNYHEEPIFPVYELRSIITKNFTEHSFVDSHAESESLLKFHYLYLKIESKDKSRCITIRGKNDVPLMNIDVNSRSTSILSGVQCRFFCWNRKALEHVC